MNVEIAVCTWNRAELLAQTLESFTGLNLPPDCQLRILVVDNNSTDTTQQTLESFRDRLDIESAVEAIQGHTRCRNRAVEMASGDLLLWTDDDVLVDPDWLSAYVAAALRSPGVAFWGGRIAPLFDPPAPAWIRQNWDVLSGCFAARDLGDQPIELDPDHLPYGANFAIRTAVQKKFSYNVELGRRGNQVLGDDELELFRRLLSAGHRGQWVPQSSLQHLIPFDRASEQYVFDYFSGQGQSLVAQGKPWSPSPFRMGWSLAWERTLYHLKRRVSNSRAWVPHLIRSGLVNTR